MACQPRPELRRATPSRRLKVVHQRKALTNQRPPRNGHAPNAGLDIATTYEYDILGRLVTLTDGNGNETRWEYDAAGRQVGRGYANGDTILMEYDLQGRVTKRTDPNGAVSLYAYDNRDLLTRRTCGAAGVQTFAYDATYGRMTQLKTYRDGTGWTGATWPETPGTADTTTWTYQTSTGLLTAKTYADTKGTSYTYDSAGRLASRTWDRQAGGNDLVTTYSYSSTTGELTGVDYSDSTPDIAYTYNRFGAPATVTDALGTHTFAYDSALQPATETISDGLYAKVITRKCQSTGQDDVPGRDAGFQIGTTQDPDADVDVTYSYDAYGRFDELTDGTDTFAYAYLANSNLLQTVTYPDSITATRAYESSRNLIDYVENKIGTTTVSKYDYANDAVGRRTSVVNTGDAFTNSAFNLYLYNDRSEVVDAKRYLGTNINDTGSPVSAQDFEYGYDPIGNRESYQVAQGTATTYTANQLNQYTATTDPAESFSYDTDGNLTADGTFTYTWNGENRMVRAETANPGDGDPMVEFTYDYMGRRIRKTSYTWDGQAEDWTLVADHAYVYDAWNPILILDNADNDTTLKTFAWGLDLSQSLQGAGGVGGLLSVADATGENTVKYYYVYDANGNVSQLIDTNGNTAAHYEYKPFGGQILALGTYAAANEFRFSTKFLDSETELYYYGHRFYSPRLGRWTSRDPLGERGGVSLFCHSYNDLFNRYDYLGLWWGCNDKCSDGDKKIVGVKYAIVNSNVLNPSDWNEITKVAEDVATLTAIIQATIQLGAGATIEAILTIVGNLLPSVPSSVIELYVQALNIFSSNMSGARLWTIIEYRECQLEYCCIIFPRYNWGKKVIDGPRMCTINTAVIYPGEPPVYGSYWGALANLDQCIGSHTSTLGL